MKGVSPFASVLVTQDQTRRYERQVRRLLDDTLREYDAQVAACNNGKNPLLDKWQWKPLKTHESLNLYKERQPTHPELTINTAKVSTGSSSGHSSTMTTERPAKPTKAVAMAAYAPETAVATSAAVPGSSSIASTIVTGHVDGCLNDVMYGLIATDTAELQLRLRYMPDAEVLDTAMISCIQTPSSAEPFQFLGLQWLVRGELSRVKSSARSHRDFVLLVASGVVQHQSHEIGYSFCQSVELPECGELESQGLTRAWLSTCSLFVPVKGNSTQTQVFSRGFADFKGKMQDYHASNMMTSLVLGAVAEAALCGQNKKLGWLLNFKGAAAEFRRMHPEAKTSSNRCGICDRKFGVLTSVHSCNLCQAKMCSRCRVSRDISFVKRSDTTMSITQSRSWDEGHQTGSQVRCLTAVLCKNCKMNASHMDARLMARREVEVAYGLHEMAHTAPVGSAKTPIQQGRSSLGADHSKSGDTPSQLRFWAAGIDTAANDDIKQLNGVIKPKLLLGRMDSDSSDTARTKLDSSFASTLPSPRDRDSSQEESSFELTSYQHRQQYQPQYIEEDPEISYTYTPPQSANTTNAQADLVRRMQELQMKSESVYQFTSQMNANTRYRHQQFASSSSNTAISELD
ncbi:hypothetical protein PHMEG_00018407 [Phytophthora megakarya]|uniref:FYVE-type domain-containing protein n=1 Tax=Phytophthora megakarya TaxID=4795 RepID=A0A225VUY6_9STRA|nr:hypothetical protein PHMEG_00018407 [Phytophthora megakarya]